jgi:membrane-associated phospholipid phosphatase
MVYYTRIPECFRSKRIRAFTAIPVACWKKMRRPFPFFEKWTAVLNATDRLLIAFWIFMACVSLAFCVRIPRWPLMILVDLAAVMSVCFLGCLAHSSESKRLRWIHDWSAFPLVLFSFKQTYYMIGPIHGHRDFDPLLIAADRWLTGTNPTEWLARISHPFLTETLQIAYTLFYTYFIIVGVELYRKAEVGPFRHFRFTVVYGFLISYIGYFFLPAAGPRFTLHGFSKIGTELPGLLFTPFLRRFVNFFESIPADVPDAVARAAAQRDVFPSGHTMMTLVVIILAYRYRLKVRHPLLVAGILLIFATVYLRYHYLIDLVGGIVLAVFCLATSKNLYHGFSLNSEVED